MSIDYRTFPFAVLITAILTLIPPVVLAQPASVNSPTNNCQPFVFQAKPVPKDPLMFKKTNPSGDVLPSGIYSFSDPNPFIELVFSNCVDAAKVNSHLHIEATDLGLSGSDFNPPFIVTPGTKQNRVSVYVDAHIPSLYQVHFAIVSGLQSCDLNTTPMENTILLEFLMQ